MVTIINEDRFFSNCKIVQKERCPECGLLIRIVKGKFVKHGEIMTDFTTYGKTIPCKMSVKKYKI